MNLEKELKISQSEQFVINCLQKEFLKRIKKNPGYSRRAFANSLKIDQSYLTKVMHGKINLSQRMVLHLCSALNIKPQILKGKLVNYEMLDDNNFEIISNWIHFSILELLKITGFESNFEWIAKKLDVHPAEAEDGVNRLLQMEILKRTEDGELALNKVNLNWNSSAKTTYAKKMLQKGYLKKAIVAIDNIDFSERENSSLTVSIPKTLVPQLKEEIQIFKDKIDRLCESQVEKDEVYQLCIALFPISKS